MTDEEGFEVVQALLKAVAASVVSMTDADSPITPTPGWFKALMTGAQEVAPEGLNSEQVVLFTQLMDMLNRYIDDAEVNAQIVKKPQ